MAQKEPETGPSLELPSLFGRRKRRATGPPVEETPTEPTADAGGDTTTIPRTEAPSEPETQDATEVIPAVEPAPAPASAHTPAVTPTAIPEPSPAPSPEPTHARSADTTPAPFRAPAPAPAPAPAASVPRRAPERAATAGATPTRAVGGGRRRAAGTSRTLPEIAASTAAFLVGALVGLAGCVLTYLGLKGCEGVTGTDSCGGPGLLVLAVILVVMVLLGAAILKALRVPEAGNVSFLGVGILTVVALVFLASYLYDPWMFVVVPAVTAVSFALARWVSTLYAEDVLDDDRGPHHDIR